MEFKRMLSWELSTPREEPPKKPKKKKRKRREPEESDSNSEGDDVEYVAINSGGEEEKYYPAPESPLSSQEEATASGPDAPPDKVSLPPQEPGRSNRSKRRRRYALRKAKAEFFQPLCDLIETKLFVETGPPDVKSFNEVPTLVELCLRTAEQGPKEYSEDELPYLLRSLLSHDRQLQSTVSCHVRWLEKLLGAYEVCGSSLGWGVGENAGKEFSDYAYQLQTPWAMDSLVMTEFPATNEGLHCLLPVPTSSSTPTNNTSVPKAALIRPLFHFANYFYPLLLGDTPAGGSGEGASPLTVSQLSAIRHINKFLRLRYPRLTGVLSESMKLWPGYVYWARGNSRLAATVFTSAVQLLTEDEDRSVALNELARMCVMFGDRASAWRHFRRSAELTEGVFKKCFGTNPLYVDSCAWALQCATMDRGWLDRGAAREAARSWAQLLKQLPDKLRVLHMAACESRLLFHCGYSTAAADPGAKEEEGLKWLRECEDLLMTCSEVYPLLNFYLAQIRAMMGLTDASLRAYSKFVMDYAGFIVWEAGRMPGRLFSVGVPTQLSSHPWQPLLDLMTSQRLSLVPLLSLLWRATLLHPRYPYGSRQENKVADHSPEDIGLRMTAEGYLTADICMDLPPLRTVLLDPYTGSLCFSQKASLQHYWLSQAADNYTLPYPLRLYESEDCAVELVMACTVDAELPDLPASNYLAQLHWYGSDGSHHRLDVRRLIRQHRKKAILDLIPYRNSLSGKGKEQYLEVMMEQGMKLDIEYLSRKDPPSKYKVTESVGGKDKKQKKKPNKKATRDTSVHDFYLFLSSHVVYGKCTLMLAFCLEENINRTQVLMFVNCSNAKSFLDAKVYCVGDRNGFSDLFPSPTMAVLYPNRHLKHVKYAVANCTEKKEKLLHSRVIVDEEGTIVRREEGEDEEFPVCLIAGPRQITWVRGDQEGESVGMLMSSSLDLTSTEVLDAFPVIEAVEVVPGILFIATPQGVSLLHPGSLQPLPLEGLSDKRVAGGTSESRKWYQFWGNGYRLNVLKTYDVGAAEQPLQQSGSGSDDYGSGTTVFTVNDRLLVVRVMPKASSVEVMLDIQLPGEVTDFHPIGNKGYIVTASQFHDHFREDLYWISVDGKLRGMLPCLGHGAKSFCSAVLGPMTAEAAGPAQINPDDTGGMYVFFNDGQGGISCIRLGMN